jgi:hypothetical protein
VPGGAHCFQASWIARFVRQVPADAHDTSTLMSIVAAGGGSGWRHFDGERFIGMLDCQPR